MPLTICRNTGRYVSAPNIVTPTTNETPLIALNTRLWNRCSGRIGSGRALPVDEDDPQQDAAHDQGEARVEAQAHAVPPRLVKSTIPASEPVIAAAPAKSIDGLPRSRRRVEDDTDHDERHEPERDVDQEDPAPAHVLDDEAAHERPDHRGEAEDAREDPLVAAAVARRDRVADDRRARSGTGPRRPGPERPGTRSAPSCSARARTGASPRERSRSPPAARSSARRGRRACRRAGS